jgi:hypothetical protein
METADRLMRFVREMKMDFSPHDRDSIAACVPRAADECD